MFNAISWLPAALSDLGSASAVCRLCSLLTFSCTQSFSLSLSHIYTISFLFITFTPSYIHNFLATLLALVSTPVSDASGLASLFTSFHFLIYPQLFTSFDFLIQLSHISSTFNFFFIFSHIHNFLLPFTFSLLPFHILTTFHNFSLSYFYFPIYQKESFLDF